ncbi:MAG TPA: ExeM/NucH family extracellular endonuclease [Gemmatimonas sp.]|uniref:ExeM/NucH family extracellular endonuclease n=1 Tax=Gemmatimonas sp. TaxID=1962908 RepID=UPI002ED9333E
MHIPKLFTRSWRVLPTAVIAAMLAACADRPMPTSAVPEIPAPRLDVASAATELFFSEYIEGSSNNKALEIYNGTGSAIDLAAGQYKVLMYNNGAVTPNVTINLTGTVPAGGVFVIAHGSANAGILAKANQTNSAGWFNGNDAVSLVKGNTTLDVIGQIGNNPGTEWGTGLTSTADNTLRRKSSICTGDANSSDAFNPATEWDGFATDNIDGLGAHTATCGTVTLAPAVSSTTPTAGAGNVAAASDIAVTFTMPVTVSGTWYTISCTNSGAHAATVTGGTTNSSFTLNPTTDFAAGEACTVTIVAAQVVDAANPTVAMTANHVLNFSTLGGNTCSSGFTPTYAIQGSGASAAITGTVTTQGVVVGDFEGAQPALRGFYIQDQTGDGNAATSDGLFVFNNTNNSVSLGDVVRVTGTAGEFQEQTQISNVTDITVCSSGATITPTDVTFPVASSTFLERYEGMLVRLPQSLYVTEHFQLGRFGQVVMSVNARQMQPTNVVAPGAAAAALQAQNNLGRIIIDDATNDQNPDPIVFGRGGNPLSASNTLRGGDVATGIVGIMTYTWSGNEASGNAYRVRPIGAMGGGVPNFVATNARPMAPTSVGGTLRVSSFNVLNYFNSFSGCTYGVGGGSTDCRGADSQTEFNRQVPKTISALMGLNADVLGIVEIENDGYGANSAIAHLVAQLNAQAGANTYAFINADAATSQTNSLGTDAIKVALIYKPARVTPVGNTSVLNTVAFVNGGDGAPRNRPALAQAFQQADGARFIAVVNHFKSKGSACNAPDAGDGQANCNAVRVAAATQLRNWLTTDPTGTGDPDVLILGDLNAYAKEDPIMVLRNAGFIDLLESRIGPNAYSYAFDGQWGYLDHAMASSSIAAQITGVTSWHINADEPNILDYNTDYKSAAQIASLTDGSAFRSSDHDPVLIGLTLTSPVVNDPSLTVTPPASWTAGVSASLGVKFSSTKGAPYTVRINWGDSTPNTQFVSTVAPTAPLLRPHTYATAGSHTVTVSVTDRSGASTTQTLTITVQ